MVKVSTQNSNMGSMLDDLIAQAQASVDTKDSRLVDIITFCESEHYLNFLGQDPPLTLWPMQRIVLKMFYRGTEGNEHITLDDGEIELLKQVARDEELDYDPQYGGFEQVLEKFKRPTMFTHLLLIMGRRSSKTTIAAIISAYEAYRLLECPEGNPQKFYGIAPEKNIHIINVAVNEKQALDPLFVEIEAKIVHSPYFLPALNKDAYKQGEIHLLTKRDRAENERRKKEGIPGMVDGSVVLMSGHSNSASLRGHATICILFDEFAHFKTSTGAQSGDEVYNALLPSMKQFGASGKVIMLSDPRGKDGMFWRLFQLSQQKKTDESGVESFAHDDILALQLPTWRMNPQKEFSRETLEKTERPKDPITYLTTWGARFVGTAGDKFFDDARLTECIDVAWKEPQYGDRRYKYYLHLDPAKSSHNYAACLVHTVTLMNKYQETKKKIVVDLVKYWRPDQKGPVDLNKVQDYILDLHRKFRLTRVTFDTFQSQQTIQNLKKYGINAEETPYTDSYISDIYGELKNLVNQGDIIIVPDQLLCGELKNLCYKLTGRGMIRYADKKSEYPTDDCADALAGAAFQCLNHISVKGYPKSSTMKLRI